MTRGRSVANSDWTSIVRARSWGCESLSAVCASAFIFTLVFSDGTWRAKLSKLASKLKTLGHPLFLCWQKRGGHRARETVRDAGYASTHAVNDDRG